jgi:hypothetical protein
MYMWIFCFFFTIRNMLPGAENPSNLKYLSYNKRTDMLTRVWIHISRQVLSPFIDIRYFSFVKQMHLDIFCCVGLLEYTH